MLPEYGNLESEITCSCMFKFKFRRFQ